MKAAVLLFGVSVFFLVVVLVAATANEENAKDDCSTPLDIGGVLQDGRQFTAEMAQNAATIIDAGQSAPIEAQQIAVAVALADTGLTSVSGSLFQQGQQTPEEAESGSADVRDSVTPFLAELQNVDGWESMPPAEAAQAVQRTATPARYEKAIPDGRRIYAALTDQSSPVDCAAAPGEATGDQVAVPTKTGSTITVDASLAPALQQLLGDAALEGVVLGGWGFRDPEAQIRLRRKHCGSSTFAIYEMKSSKCRPPTARPGRSMHEQGLAVDFTCNGGSISTRSNRCFRWLAANANRYGLKNLPSEPWHWSVSGR